MNLSSPPLPGHISHPGGHGGRVGEKAQRSKDTWREWGGMRAAGKGPASDSPVPSILTVGWLEGTLAMIRDQNGHPWRLPVARSGVQWASLAQLGEAVRKSISSVKKAGRSSMSTLKAGSATQIFWLCVVFVTLRGCQTCVPELSVQGAVRHSSGPGSETPSQTHPETGD